jgi:hypothetical protein
MTSPTSTSTTTSTAPDPHGLPDLRGLTESEKWRVEIATAQATSYVWGRQDAGESEHDTGYSVEFGRVYGNHVRAYLREQIGVKYNIASAFDLWRKTGQIS